MSSVNSIFIPIESLAKDSKRNESFDSMDLFEPSPMKKGHQESSPQAVADVNRLTPGGSIVISSVFPRSASEALFDNSTKFRQLPCRTFISVGTCPYRERCVYLHDPRCICREAKTKTRRKNKEDIVVDALFWPVMPVAMVSTKLDQSRQPHVIQPYSVPIPQMDSYRSHDQAVYSMWMHFVDFCQANSDAAPTKRADEAPCFKAPDTPFNAYTDKERLEVFRVLSAGGKQVIKRLPVYTHPDVAPSQVEPAKGLKVHPPPPPPPLLHRGVDSTASVAAANAVAPSHAPAVAGLDEPFIPIDIRNLHYPPVHLKKSYSGASFAPAGSNPAPTTTTAAALINSMGRRRADEVKPAAVRTVGEFDACYSTPLSTRLNDGDTKRGESHFSFSPNTVAGAVSPSHLKTFAGGRGGYSDVSEPLTEPRFPEWQQPQLHYPGERDAFHFYDDVRQSLEGQEWEGFRGGFTDTAYGCAPPWTGFRGAVHDGAPRGGCVWNYETEEWVPEAAATAPAHHQHHNHPTHQQQQHQEYRFKSSSYTHPTGATYAATPSAATFHKEGSFYKNRTWKPERPQQQLNYNQQRAQKWNGNSCF